MTAQSTDLIFHISLGEVVKAWRQARGLTVTGLAARAGMAKGYISEVENNKIRRPNDDQLIRLADAMSIPVLYLVNRRLPEDLSLDEQVKDKEVQGSFGGFASPLALPPHRKKKEKKPEGGVTAVSPVSPAVTTEGAQLRQILDKLAELQALIEAYIARKEKV